MRVQMKAAFTSLLIMASFAVGSVARAQSNSIFLGEAENGTRVMFESRLNNDYRKAVKWIDTASTDRPRTAQEYVKRMKANCSKRYGGHGALGMLAMMGPEILEEMPQEWAGDSIGFASAQIAAAPQDDPSWFVHWAESSFSMDSATQIMIAVAAQTSISQMAFGLMDDVCQYYLLPNRNKLPIPLTDIDRGIGAQQVSQMSPEEAVIVKRVYKNVRARRALVNGGAMGIGMVLGQNFIEAKNDPNLRRCAREMFKKRWGQVEDFAEYNTACKTAARTWFSKSRSTDLAASIISSLLSGGVTYGIREASGAVMHSTGMMDRSSLLRYLSSPQLRNRIARRALMREGGKAAWYTIRGLKFFGKTSGTGFAVEVLLEAGTGIVVYNVDQHVIRPILIPWAKQQGFQWEMRTDTNDLESSLNRALSGNQNWETTKYIAGGGMVPTSTAVKVAVPSVESLISTMIFKNSQWRDHVLQDVNEIRSNWMDAVKYPDAVMNQGKIFYDAMIDLGSHDSLYPTPMTWDFATNANSKYKTPYNSALRALSANTPEAKQKLDNLIYELDTAYYYIGQLSSVEGRRKLLTDKLVSEQFLNRVATPALQAALKRDGERVQTAGLTLIQAFEGNDVENNVRLGIESLVKLVNDGQSIFAFPASYRVGEGSTADAYARTLRGRFSDIGDKYGYYDGSDNCGQVTRNGTRMVKKVDRFPAPNTHDGKLQLRFRCNNQDRYAFVQGVFQNRIYVALKNYVGFPFKLQPKVEDVEQILNVLSNGELFQSNIFKAMTPASPYGVTPNLMAQDVRIFGVRLPGREGNGAVRLYSNLDLFVNKLLCGNPLSSQFIGENDIPILEKLRKEGLRMKMGAPRIAVELDGRSTPFVCNVESTMTYTKYVDYFAKDFMFKDRGNVAPMRTVLTYTGSVAGDTGANAASPIPRQYTDYLDLAMRRIRPEYLRDPSKFESQWDDRIVKPYTGFAENRGLQGRYESLMKQTMTQQGIVWRRKGDYNKCVYRTFGDFLNCSSDNSYKSGDIINPFTALSAFQQHEAGSPVARTLNASIANGLDQFVQTNLEQPLGKITDNSGRGLYAATAAELNLYEKIIWRVAKNLQGRMSRARVDSRVEMTEVKSMLRRLHRANEITWQMIDENTPMHVGACNAGMRAQGCTTSRIAAFSIVESVLPMVAYPSQREYMKRMEVQMNGRLMPVVRSDDNRLVTNLSNRSEVSIDELMKNFADSLQITPQNGLGTIRSELPQLAFKFSRTDSFFRTAKTLAVVSIEMDLLRTVRSLSKMIWMKQGTGANARYIVPAADRLVLQSIVVEAVRAIRSNFTSIHNQVALFDAFKRGGDGDPKIGEKFKPIEEFAHKLEDVVTSSLDYYTETSCVHRAALDRIYKARPDLNKSVSCAVNAGQLTLDSAAIKRFENVIP